MEVALVALKRGEKSQSLVQPHDDGYVSEDEHLHNLETSGQMQQVIGSQSLLSQEIHHLETDSPPQSQSDFMPPQSQSQRDPFSQDLGTLAEVVSNVNADEPFDSQQMVHQYGLLSQDPGARTSSRAARDNENLVDSQASRGSSQGGFGTLLDAVSIFQSQEEAKEKELQEGTEEDAVVEQSGETQAQPAASNPAKPTTTTTNSTPSRSSVPTRSSSRIKAKRPSTEVPSAAAASAAAAATSAAAAAKENKRSNKLPSLPLSKSSSGNVPTSNIPIKPSTNLVAKPIAVTTTTNKASGAAKNRKRKRKDDNEQAHQQQLAHRAADLAQRTINDPELAKRLLLSMALTRENPRSAPETLPGPGHVLPEGFFWAHYPPLEKVLKDNMAEYYELSITKCQSAQQQSFNNTLVELVRAESNRQGWLYASCFTDKNLRDRIRCYYKTHIQNAKKRLRTMVKNPTKRANARHLCAHLDMIEKNVEKNAIVSPQIDPETNAVITHQDWGSSFAGPAQDAAKAIVAAGDRAASFEARVEASVAAATKAVRDDQAAKKARLQVSPDFAASGRSVPVAATNSAAAALAPDALNTVIPEEATSMPPELVEAQRVKDAAAVKGDPIAAEATRVAIEAKSEKVSDGDDDDMPPSPRPPSPNLNSQPTIVGELTSPVMMI